MDEFRSEKKCCFIQILKRFLEIVQSVQSLSSYKYENAYLAKRKQFRK